MKTLQFEKEINAPKQKVWDSLWNENSYSKWTSSFNADSRMETDWQIGGKTLFVDGEGNGMLSTIRSKKEPEEIVFEHYGEVMKGVEDTTSDRVKAYAGAKEKYFLTEDNGVTKVKVELDTTEEYEKMMTDGFEKGLQILKELSEK